jgi:hypothetical protein
MSPAPTTPDELHAWITENLGVHIPRTPIIPGHAAPFDYLCFAFGLGGAKPADPGAPTDCVVWANRGGGKTFLGAVATLLDLVFRPTIEVRILAGSLEQARRMHAHLRRLFDPREHPELAELVDGKITDRRLTLKNGSSVELLAQSQTSVRGTRVQKLRCDEADLFNPDIWEAAQLTTRSKVCGGTLVRASIECLSTMHVPYGLMHRLVAQCREGKRALFKWGVVDVLAPCEEERPCKPCVLLPECGGAAKRAARGHISIDDAVQQKRRVPLTVWESEMLCLRARRTDAVLPEFDPAVHTFAHDGPKDAALWCAGMDFGFRAPTVIVLAALARDGVLWVMDEHVAAGEVVSKHVERLSEGLAREGVPAWPRPAFVAPDPAGQAANEQTGRSCTDLIRAAGFGVRISRATITQGLTLLRARLAPGSGEPPRLFVHQRCKVLIESLERYHYDPRRPESATPVKGEFDHAVDALRYLVQALDMPSKTAVGKY